MAPRYLNLEDMEMTDLLTLTNDDLIYRLNQTPSLRGKVLDNLRALMRTSTEEEKIDNARRKIAAIRKWQIGRLGLITVQFV